MLPFHVVKQLSILQFNKTHFLPELEARGHQVLVAGVEEEQGKGRPDAWSQTRVDLMYRTGEPLQAILDRLPKGFVPDRIVYHDDSRPAFRVTDWRSAKVPTLFYSIDAHIHAGWHPQMSGQFDAVLVAQRDYVEKFSSYISDVRWFPLWAPEEIDVSGERTIPVCFRGNLNPVQRSTRVAFLASLAERVPLDYREGYYKDSLPHAKIILNEAINDDVNFRIFESLMCGGLLLTPLTGNGLLDLFKEGEHLVTYEKGNVDDAARKILYLLNHEEERERIALAGRNEVLKRHSWKVRGSQFADILENLAISPRSLEHFSVAFHLLFTKQTNPSLGPLLSESAASVLLESARKREQCDSLFILMVAECYREFRLSGRFDDLISFLGQLITCYPEQATFSLLLIEALTGVGQMGEARTIAAHLSDNIEDTLIQAASVASTLSANSFFEAMKK